MPVLSNLTATKVNDGDDTYTLKVTGNAVDSSDVTWVQIRFKNINDPNADTFWLSTSSFDSEGAFTMNRSLDNDNGGTWIADYIQAKDALGNQFNQEIRSGGDGSPLGDLTFDITSSTENSSDASAPSFSNFTSSIAADGDGTYTINIAGKVIDDSTVNNVNFRFNSSTDGSHFWQSINSGSIDSSGNFTMAINAENINPGKYYLSYLTARDASGNEYSKDIRDGGSGSPIENLTFNYAAKPTDISFTNSTITEETLGTSLGIVKVNDVANDGLYTISISGTDASSLEISSKGYLRLKDNVKLDYETKTTLEFTLTAQNPQGDSYSENFTINVIDNGLVGSSLSNVGFIGIDIDSSDLGINDSILPGNNSGDLNQVVDSSYEHDDFQN